MQDANVFAVEGIFGCNLVGRRCLWCDVRFESSDIGGFAKLKVSSGKVVLGVDGNLPVYVMEFGMVRRIGVITCCS